jgi:hypothetical protein
VAAVVVLLIIILSLIVGLAEIESGQLKMKRRASLEMSGDELVDWFEVSVEKW